MPAEVRVLGATALFTAALVFLAWWLGQHHDDIAHRLHGDDTVTAQLPSFSWGNDTPRALPAMTRDAGLVAPDAGEMSGTEAELAAILIPAICGPIFNACQCGAYPSPYASEEERVRATSCEEDMLGQYRAWWSAKIDAPVILEDPSVIAYLLRPLAPEACLENAGSIALFLRSDAVEGEPCVEGIACRDGSACEDRQCVRYQQEGEACLGAEELDAWVLADDLDDIAERDCADGLHCVAHECQVDPSAFIGSMFATELGDCGPSAFSDGERCIPIGTRCTSSDDCGSGYCGGGVSESRCIRGPAPLTTCPPGECDACSSGQWQGGPNDTCIPYAREGERCEELACDPGTTCERFVTDGRCISTACSSTSMLYAPEA